MEFEIDQITTFIGFIACGAAMQESAVYKMDRGITDQAQKDLELSLEFFGLVTTVPRETLIGGAAAFHHVAHVQYASSLALLGRVALLERDYELARGYLRTADLGLQRVNELRLPALMWQLKAEAWGIKGMKHRLKLLRRIFGLVDPEHRSWLLRVAVVVDSLHRKI